MRTAGPRHDDLRRVVLRASAVWLVLIAAEIAHGILRAILLVPQVGEFRSNQIGVFTGSAILLVIATFTQRWIGARRHRERLAVGFVWLVLTVAFEILFGRFVMGLSWARIAADYNIAQGGLMPLGLVVLLVSPMIGWRLAALGKSACRESVGCESDDSSTAR